MYTESGKCVSGRCVRVRLKIHPHRKQRKHGGTSPSSVTWGRLPTTITQGPYIHIRTHNFSVRCNISYLFLETFPAPQWTATVGALLTSNSFSTKQPTTKTQIQRCQVPKTNPSTVLPFFFNAVFAVSVFSTFCG